MKLTDYIELVEWSVRQIRNKKNGAIASTLPSLLNQLGVDLLLNLLVLSLTLFISFTENN